MWHIPVAMQHFKFQWASSILTLPSVISYEMYYALGNINFIKNLFLIVYERECKQNVTSSWRKQIYEICTYFTELMENHDITS